MTKHSEKAYDIPRKAFAAILWKVSLLRRITNKGRKVGKKDQHIYDESLSKSNIGHRDVIQFLSLSSEHKELRCLKIWKNLRKYFTFVETADGWSVRHPAFQRVNNIGTINSIMNEILPIRPKKRRRTLTTTAVIDVDALSVDPLMALATEASKRPLVIN
uniref:Uncharacterized protein n=1 Tax=Clandestinovirus TaxID=2831644 RepID=A0A8F8KKQ8_9VIRU|nr:hypothetical protein KOM_12_179 [Clandestinovirus]